MHGCAEDARCARVEVEVGALTCGPQAEAKASAGLGEHAARARVWDQGGPRAIAGPGRGQCGYAQERAGGETRAGPLALLVGCGEVALRWLRRWAARAGCQRRELWWAFLPFSFLFSFLCLFLFFPFYFKFGFSFEFKIYHAL
jgi:hypothetical protein